jgi:hypothetical protein
MLATRERQPPAAEQRHPERPQLAPGVPAADGRVVRHDMTGGVLVRRLEHGYPGIDPAEGGAGQDQLPVREHPPQPLEMPSPNGFFVAGHGRREVVPRRMDEIDPLLHAPSLPGAAPPVNAPPGRSRGAA